MTSLLVLAAAGPVEQIATTFGANWPALISNIISFVLVALLLKKFAFGPIQKVLKERAEKIEQGLANAERIKRDGASTVFSPQDLQVDERSQRVGLRGLLTTFISDRRVSEVSKGYAIELQYAGGRIYLKTFRETNPNDPLELQTRSGAAPAAPSGPTSDASSPAAAPAVPAGAPVR